jgi:hypothetical protein
MIAVVFIDLSLFMNTTFNNGARNLKFKKTVRRSGFWVVKRAHGEAMMDLNGKKIARWGNILT